LRRIDAGFGLQSKGETRNAANNCLSNGVATAMALAEGQGASNW
jgi:hypothetical protein